VYAKHWEILLVVVENPREKIKLQYFIKISSTFNLLLIVFGKSLTLQFSGQFQNVA
jgi:hypothetical protein